MVDSVYRTRSLGVAAEGLPDQYADGKAAKVWEYYIGCKQTRTTIYRSWFSGWLKDHKCKSILDVACGTGVDSIMLLEDGFNVVSTDASDKMLKYALKERWTRRKESSFDKWVIEEANWLTLAEDLDDIEEGKGDFDAVCCLGNSFAHLPDFSGNLENQKVALENFKAKVKPGGYLVIDHRNYDDILRTGTVPANNVYYNSAHILDITCSVIYVNAKPSMITLDYLMDLNSMVQEDETAGGKALEVNGTSTHRFRLSYYPHTLKKFTELVKEVFGEAAQHRVYGDFKPVGEIECPAYYIHVVQKPFD